MPPQPGLRFLEATVYVMGGLLVVMLIVLIGGIAWKVKQRGSAPPEQARLVELGLPAGAAVNHVSIDGDRVAVTTAAEIIVVDVRKGAIVARLKLRAE